MIPPTSRSTLPTTSTSTSAATSSSTASTPGSTSVATPTLRPATPVLSSGDTFFPAKPKPPVNLTGFNPFAPSFPAATSDVTASTKVSAAAPKPAEKQGPRLPGLERGWVPQGQAYDAERDEILTSYYETVDGVEHGHLGIMSKDGTERTNVALGGYGTTGEGAEGPSHAGGVATEGDFVFVSDTEGVYAYRREDIENAEPGEEVEAESFTPTPALERADEDDLVSSGSTIAVKDGWAYVAGYSPNEDGKDGAVWRYKIDSKTGGMVEDSLQGPIQGPDRIQGITVTEDGLMFTSGDQKLFEQELDFDTFEAEPPVAVANLDGYAQGLSIIDGEVWITYESGSDKYADDAEGAGFETREHIQRIPLEELDSGDLDLEDGGSTSGGGGGGGDSW